MDAEDIDGDCVERFCHQHTKEVLTQSGFYSRKTGKWVSFEGADVALFLESWVISDAFSFNISTRLYSKILTTGNAAGSSDRDGKGGFIIGCRWLHLYIRDPW
jgi:hypothetical protein